MNIQRVKQGASITFYNGLYMVFVGIFCMFFYQFNMKNNFNGINQLWGFFIKFNPDISYIFFVLNLILAVFLIGGGITIMYLSDFIYKRKEKFTWVMLFIVGILFWASILTGFIFLKNIILIVLTFLGWASFVLGMLLPISYYLEKSYREY